jgi:hypothetical protein
MLWGQCFVIGDAVLKMELRAEVGGFGVKKFSGQGANFSRDGFQ